MKKKFTKKTGMCVAIVIGAIIIPLLYSYFYLGAFWDPYSRLDNIPVAVVNNDSGYLINGEERNIGEEVSEKLKEDGTFDFVFTDEEEALSGKSGNEYYATITIPEDFSENIASATTIDKKSATIIYSANQKRNYLASQILNTAISKIESSTKESVNEEIVQELADNLNSVPDQMTEMQDGINQLYEGTGKLSDGADDLASGTSLYNSSFKEFKTGITTAKNGAYDLNSGMKKLNSGAAQLAAGTTTFNTKVNEFTGGVNVLIVKTNATKAYLTNYLSTHSGINTDYPELAGFINSLSSTENTQSLSDLQTAIAQINAGSQGIKTSAGTLSEGTTDLHNGSNKLLTGLEDLSTATDKLSQASTDIAAGANTLSEGATELNSGVNELKTGVNSTISDSEEDLKALDGIADYTKTSVVVDEDNVVNVPNYGTAFAPYFLSLSLWVGGIIIFIGIYFDPDKRFKILSRESDKKVIRSFSYLLIGLAQAGILGIVLIFGLDLKVDNLTLYFLSCGLVSVVFLSIIQFLMVVFKDLGKFFTMLLLILQLTSCGGTFPMETLPKMFNVLYAFMPMTYSVGLFKQSISGVVAKETLFNAGILFGMLVAFMALTIICSGRKSKREMKMAFEK